MKSASTWVVSGQVIGASVHEVGSDAPLRYVRLQRIKDEVRILEHGNATDAADLKKQCGTRAPLALVLLTPRCLHRVVRRVGTLEELVPVAFPGAPFQEIHTAGWQEVETTGVSMMRHDHAAPIITPLREAGFRIVEIAPGPWTLMQLRPLFGEQTSETIGGHRFTTGDGVLSGYLPPTTETGTTTIGTDELPDTHLLALSLAWAHLVPTEQRLEHADMAVHQHRREEGARVWYERGLLALGAILLILLVSDTLLKSDLRSAQTDPNASTIDHAELTAANADLKERIRARETLVAQLGLTRTEPFASRAVRVLDQVPADILLDRVIIDPLLADLRPRERPTVQAQRIRIKGSCPDGQVFNAWMNVLRGTAGITNVRLITFTGDTPHKRPSFEIELTA